MKLVTIPLTQSWWISIKESSSFNGQYQVFVSKYLPVQSPRNKH